MSVSSLSPFEIGPKHRAIFKSREAAAESFTVAHFLLAVVRVVHRVCLRRGYFEQEETVTQNGPAAEAVCVAWVA
ncbi:MAG: hypothetical protein ACNA7O_09595 [Rhodobacterales bacterium]